MSTYAVLCERGFWTRTTGRGAKRRGENWSLNPFAAFLFHGPDEARTTHCVDEGVVVKLTFRKAVKP